MTIPIMAISVKFQKLYQKIIIRKDPKTNPSFHSCDFPSKMKILKLLVIQPNHADFSINLIEAQVSFLLSRFIFFISFYFRSLSMTHRDDPARDESLSLTLAIDQMSHSK